MSPSASKKTVEHAHYSTVLQGINTTSGNGFTYLRGSCPVCQGTRKDCRQSKQTGHIFCRDTSANPLGLNVIGQDINGFWIWAPKRTNDQYRRPIATAQPKPLTPNETLSREARSRQYQSLARHSGLSLRDRERLSNRGLTPEQTALLSKRLHVWTWQSNRAIAGITPLLPGVDRRGYTRKFDGIAIAVPDLDGHVLGAQIKPMRGSGYFWASSEAIGGVGIRLPNEEVPIGIYRPAGEDTTGEVNLTEGFLKPAIVALRYDRVFIGASGGNWVGSPQQLRSALEQLRPEKVVLNADAGAVQNVNVMRAYERLNARLKEWGYELWVRWWGQVEKAHGDVDEITPDRFHQARLVPFSELSALAREHLQDEWVAQYERHALATWNQARQYTPTVEVSQPYVNVSAGDFLGTDIYALKSAMGTGKTEVIVKLLEQTDRGVVAIGSRNTLLLQSCTRWEDKKKGVKFYHLHDNDAFELTADPQGRIACCVDSLHFFQPHHFDGKILILDEVLSVVKHALMSNTLRGRRDKALDLFSEAIKRAAVVIALDGNCADIAINYLAKLRDEDCQVIKLLNQFQGALMNIELIRALSSTGTIWSQNYQPVLTKLDETVKTYHQAPDGEARAVVLDCDNQRLLEAIDRIYTQQGYRVLRVDSKTVTDPQLREAIEGKRRNKDGSEIERTFDDFIAEYKPDLLLLSPTAESGLDCSIQNYFVKGFALFFGVIDAATQYQILRRVRHCLNWTVWCAEYTQLDDWAGTKSPIAHTLQKQFLEYLQADAVAALEGTDREALRDEFLAEVERQQNSSHFQTTMRFLAARNYERMHARECLQTVLEDAGHTVTVIDVEGERIDEAITEAKAAIALADSTAIYNSPDIDVAEARRIKASFSASIEDRWAAEKALLLERLPGFEHSEHWTPETICKLLFTDKGYLRRLERWWLLNHLETAQLKAEDTYRAFIEGGHLSDLKSDYSVLKGLADIGITDLLKGTHDRNSPVAKDIHRKGAWKRFKQALGRHPGKLSSLDWCGRIAGLVGITSSGKMKPNRERGTDAGDRNYTYSAPEADPLAAALLRCLESRFAKWQQTRDPQPLAQPAPSPDHLPLIKDSQIRSGDQVQRQTGQASWPTFQKWVPGEAVTWLSRGVVGMVGEVQGAFAQFFDMDWQEFRVAMVDLGPFADE
ncbi:MAG: plasmid replication protein, CyRepA1 family [Cyanobacteria bacterium P01_F01_bin.86]